MALQLGAMRDALLEAGARPETAAKAAEELAGYEDPFTAVRADISALRADIRADIASLRADTRADIAALRSETRTDIAGLRGDITLLRWMLGVIFAGVLSLVLKAFIP